jgi:hypothetical protein
VWRGVFVLVGVAFVANSASWFIAGRRSRRRARFLRRSIAEAGQRRYWRALAAKSDLTGALFLTVAIAVLGVAVEPNARFADLLLLFSAGPLVVSLAWIERFRWAAGVSESSAETAQQLREGEVQTEQLSAQLARRLRADGLITSSVVVDSIYFPAEGLVGGDFVGCTLLPDGPIAFVVGDITGHGLTAAIDAIRVKDLVMAILRRGASPANALTDANAHLHESGDVLATAFAGVCDGHTLRYASAGHVPAIVDGRRGDRELGPTGRILGALPTLEIADVTVALQADDLLIVFTDGLLEAHGPDGGLAEDQIAAIVRRGGLGTLREAVISGQHLPPRDDIAALQVRILRSPSERHRASTPRDDVATTATEHRR